MKRITEIGIIFFFVLFLAAPLFAQENLEEVVMPEQDLALAEVPDEGVITGEVISLDVDSGAIVVKTEDGIEKTFSVLEGDTILWKGIDDIELSDITVGEAAEVGYYTDETGTHIASWVDVLIEEGTIPLEAAPEVETLPDITGLEAETETVPQE